MVGHRSHHAEVRLETSDALYVCSITQSDSFFPPGKSGLNACAAACTLHATRVVYQHLQANSKNVDASAGWAAPPDRNPNELLHDQHKDSRFKTKQAAAARASGRQLGRPDALADS